ncbi:MAG: phage Gp37/Gp68 family protein [Planctomycetes bacterium]|nr:phage Gp37/Gp68 family protein [Planctomycetota bacterium]
MANNSGIEWTEATWNPVAGCTPVSPGCLNCYAARMALRLGLMPHKSNEKYHGVAELSRSGRPVFNGRVNISEDALDLPRTWKRARLIFVNSMSDLFHEQVPDSFVKRVFDVMQACPQHTFQVLTKRPERLEQLADDLPWPSNVWIGTSVESARYFHRIESLATARRAAVRFLSCEPLLGPLPDLPLEGIDWVIVGGESGPGARPMKENWVDSIKDRCLAHGVAFFFKQWGGTNKKATGRLLGGRTWDELPAC